MKRALLVAVPILAILVLLPACDRMNRQPKLKDFSASALFADGQTMRLPPEGAMAVDDPAIAATEATRPPMTLALLQRGRERYGIYCAMCHDAAGTGAGVIPSRGFPKPKRFAEPDQAALTDRQIMDAIGKGYGVMYGFADRVPPADRWAITAYVRALQLSQDAPANQLSTAEQARLEGAHG
ncbi:MAG TPA: cytochrome c [Caulobacteraceae bacterium]|jgi:mono/diheme cytochrome c family protein